MILEIRYNRIQQPWGWWDSDYYNAAVYYCYRGQLYDPKQIAIRWWNYLARILGGTPSLTVRVLGLKRKLPLARKPRRPVCHERARPRIVKCRNAK